MTALRRPRWAWLLALALLTVLTAVTGEGVHAPALTEGPAACAPCHAQDARTRWEAHRTRPCTPYCLTCHRKEEMSRHHMVGSPLPRAPNARLPLTADHKTACCTCHDLARPRYDGVRWKAASLADRMFRQEARYPTYFLAERNDQGQLCLACH